MKTDCLLPTYHAMVKYIQYSYIRNLRVDLLTYTECLGTKYFYKCLSLC